MDDSPKTYNESTTSKVGPTSKDLKSKIWKSFGMNDLTPKKIFDFLETSIVGQSYAKKVLSVAVYNHYKRLWHNNSINANDDNDDEYEIEIENKDKIESAMKDETIKLEKSNVLILGPTGCGKTMMAQTIAKCLNVPFVIVDCTTLTCSGYHGEDIDSMFVKLLLKCQSNVSKAQQGIIFLDEIDKLACSKRLNSKNSDVGRKNVQEEMLKLLEGQKILLGMSKYELRSTHFDTSNVLFIGSGSFLGLDEIINKNLDHPLDQLNKCFDDFSDRKKFPLLNVQPRDLVKFGMIPEFVGRFSVLVPFHDLTESMLVRMLTKTKNSLLLQYQKLLSIDDIDLEFSSQAVRSVAKLAMEQNIGARGLKSIMESCLLDSMFETPGTKVKKIKISEGVILKTKPAEYIDDDQSGDPNEKDTAQKDDEAALLTRSL